MAKKVQGIVSIVLEAGRAEANEALGPALGTLGVNVGAFVQDFNAATASVPMGTPMQTTITVYEDKSYNFVAVPQ